jgi:hypothetical protein
VLDAFHLDKQAIFDQQIRRIRADVPAVIVISRRLVGGGRFA